MGISEEAASQVEARHTRLLDRTHAVLARMKSHTPTATIPAAERQAIARELSAIGLEARAIAEFIESAGG